MPQNPKPQFLNKVVIIIICFFVLNALWVSQDNRIPFTGDDSRWLFETNKLATHLKQGDIAGFADRWQNMFIEDTNSFPRTPLFTLLSVPTFMLVGPNTDAAVITNLLVFALCSWFVYLLCLEIFKHEKQKGLIALLAVIAFNVFPGYFGLARMYMSEIMQTLLVVFISYIAIKQQQSRNPYWYLVLGVLAALAMLLRFIMPIYLVIPGLIFLYQQFKLKYSVKEVLIRFGLFVLGFLPLAATWYAQNLIPYWEFTRYTSFGPLAEITSLGPVWSPVTWLKFWNVIALWHFSWPWLLAILLLLIISAFFIIKKRLYIINLRKLTTTQKTFLLLALIPVPAFLMATLSINKTARYFLPVEVFWILLLVYIFWQILVAVVAQVKKQQLKFVFIAILLLGSLISYPFMQSVITFLPQLPRTSYLPNSGKPLKTDSSRDMYNFALASLTIYTDANSSVYILPEQVRFNDAQLQWEFAQKEIPRVFLGEFSSYHSFADGVAKVDVADTIVLDLNPDIPETYIAKYELLKEYVLTSEQFQIVTSLDLTNGAQLVILNRVKIFANN